MPRTSERSIEELEAEIARLKAPRRLRLYGREGSVLMEWIVSGGDNFRWDSHIGPAEVSAVSFQEIPHA